MSSYKPRYYQLEALECAKKYMRENGKFGLAVLPTGTGKSHIIADLIQQLFTHNNKHKILMVTQRLKLSTPVRCSYPIEPRSVGKRNKIILSDALQQHPNQELILCIARSWKCYQDLTKGIVKSLQELAKMERTSVETITRNLPLSSLKPDQIERLLKGQHTPDLSVAKLIKNPALL